MRLRINLDVSNIKTLTCLIFTVIVNRVCIVFHNCLNKKINNSLQYTNAKFMPQGYFFLTTTAKLINSVNQDSSNWLKNANVNNISPTTGLKTYGASFNRALPCTITCKAYGLKNGTSRQYNRVLF